MNKYEEALNTVKNQVVDSQADGYMEPRTVEDYNYESCNLLQELVELATPRCLIEKYDRINRLLFWCPTCGKPLPMWSDNVRQHEYPYCPYCGQKLSWGEDDE